MRKKEVKPDIVQIDSGIKLDILENSGIKYNVYATPIKKVNRWFPRQRYILLLRPSNFPVEEDMIKVNKLPAGDYLEVDKANNKIRLISNSISPDYNVTEWFYY